MPRVRAARLRGLPGPGCNHGDRKLSALGDGSVKLRSSVLHRPLRCYHQCAQHMVAIIFRNALADGNHTTFLACSQKAGVVEAEEYYGSFGWQTTKNFFQVRYEFVYIILGDFPTTFYQLVSLNSQRGCCVGKFLAFEPPIISALSTLPALTAGYSAGLLPLRECLCLWQC